LKNLLFDKLDRMYPNSYAAHNKYWLLSHLF